MFKELVSVPFVYRIAVKRALTGYVFNQGDGSVKIVVEGEKKNIDDFLEALKNDKPPISKYTSMDVKFMNYRGEFSTFEIKKSKKKTKKSGISYIPPDIAICKECLHELFDPNDRRYLYPFIACSICGPRFTIIFDLPYDRDKTTMVDFPLCSECAREYEDPLDRRFHAQVIACPVCGPKMVLCDKNGEVIDDEEPLKTAGKLIDEGYILAIRGIGGTHIATKTTEDDPVLMLRERRRRPWQPFAIMAPDINVVRSFAEVSKVEEELLTSFRRPIVALKKSDEYYLSEWISPGLHTIGVMLPYSGFHYMLFRYTKEPAVIMTSGNLPREPMAITNEDALKRLRNIADYFLLHNRRIYQRCDDSVIRVVDGLPKFLRRSRGYVPEPIILPFKSGVVVLGTGPELRVTGAVLLEDRCFLTQHIGDVEILETLEFLKESLFHMMKLTRVKKPDIIACDLHPLFLTTRLAKELAEQWNIDVVKVQHHFAHMVKLLVEHKIPLDENIVCIVADGVGYGLDGKPWGGEIFVGSYNWFERRGHLEPQPMPGGDLAAKYPARMVAGILSKVLSMEELREVLLDKCIKGFKKGEIELNIVLSQISKKINLTETTSAGRILDAISALLGVCFERTYEGEPAMRLESIATLGDPSKAKITATIEQDGGTYVINTTNILLDVLEASKKVRREHVAAAAQEALAKGLVSAAINIAMEEGIKIIGFSGGVAYNEAITKTIRKEVEKYKLKFISHRLLPPGDGGISAGQTVATAMGYR